MTQAIFYQLEAAQSASLDAVACYLVAQCYTQRQRVSVWCVDKAQAEAFDELLWQLPADRFIAHNLAGEGPKGGAMVEITWEQASALRSIVVNLSAQALPNPNRYRTIYDFVPADDAHKPAARERYKHCKQAGCEMHFAKASDVVS